MMLVDNFPSGISSKMLYHGRKKKQKNAVLEVGNYNKDYCKRSGENIYRVAGVG